MRIRALLITFMIMSQVFRVVGQTAPQVPKAPDVAALERYIDFPVDKSTGTANVSIPIYTLSIKNFNLPISLNYHTGGVKVEDMAGNCGLGWVLAAGGTISRTIKSYPDEGGYYQNRGFSEMQVTGYGGVGTPRFITGNKDTEPDMFYFNVNGYSGKFLIDKYHRVQLIPEQDIKIILDTTVSIFSKWTIIPPDGTQYVFQDVTDHNRIIQDSPPFDASLVPNAWHLTKVITPTLETVTFQYQEDGYQQRVNEHSSLTATVNGGCIQCATKSTYSFVDGHTLTKISTRNNEVLFNYKTTIREDIDQDYGGSKALDNIVIKDKFTNQVIKQFQLTTSYFQSSDNLAISPQLGSNSTVSYIVDGYLKKRLRLDAITELSSLGTPLPSYQFSYNKYNVALQTPSRLSNGQDHWGYYNGQSNNKCLVGSFTMGSCPLTNYLANRDPNYSYKKAYILDEIVYPTSGTAQYLYDNDNNPGLRIKQVVTKSGDSPIAITKNYTYYNSYITGGPPVYAQIYTINFNTGIPGTARPHITSTTNETLIAGDPQCILDQGDTYITFQEPANYTGELAGNHVYYDRVTESQPGNGSIDSYYSIYEIADYIEDAEYYPLILSKPALLAGRLTQEIVKKEDGTFLKETDYNYEYYYRKIVNSEDAIRSYESTCWNAIRFYSLYSGFGFLTQKQEKNYIYNGGASSIKTVTTNYDYAGIQSGYKDDSWRTATSDYGAPLHHFVTQETNNLSDGSLVSKRTKYALDYATDLVGRLSTDTWDSHSFGVKRLLDRNMVGMPVEEISTLTRSGTENVTSAKLTFYESYQDPTTAAELLNPKTGYGFEVLNPVAYTSAFNSSMTKDGSNMYHFNFNGNYVQKMSLDKYDSWSNVLEYHQNTAPPTALVWGYNYTYPIAEAKNASANQIYYEGFEESSVSGVVTNSGAAHSGLRYYNSTPLTVNWTRPDSRTYIITYWYKAANGDWLRREQNYTSNSLSLSDGFGYDDICIYPTDAQMSVYNYLPSVGLISSIDPSNKPSYYDYDEFNRLLNVKDHNKDIVKNYTYHYNDNSIQYLSAAKSGSFQKNDCPNQATGGSVTYSVPMGKYTSPFSQTDADAQAQADVNTNGQAYANANGICTGGTVPYYNEEVSQTFTTTCTGGQTGTDIVYKVPANTYSSMLSKFDANSQATADIAANGQNYANAHGTCRYTTLMEWNNTVADNNNRVTHVRFYNSTGSTLLFELNASALSNQFESHMIDRGNYQIVVDVQGVQYNSGVGYGCISLTGTNITRQCQNFGTGTGNNPSTNTNTYTFFIDLTNNTSFSFNLEQGPCN